MAEEVVSDTFKLSSGQWRYDIKTLDTMNDVEPDPGPLAQVILAARQRSDSCLRSQRVDVYLICLQDHAILETLEAHPWLDLFALVLYIVVHELIHIERFSRFKQNFQATPEETHSEEARVHRLTRQIVENLPVAGIDAVLHFFAHWHGPIDALHTPDAIVPKIR
ncbi:MAG TPA: hypothetical protein ENF48_04945 [Desulfobacteraceae bacterium]|nr:MAG: hypothetical protein DRH76_10515 [Deltaproteobacteria bacterium]HDI59696.1 hypothetical protein [Desulfobacteraceae bacterium]